MLQVVSIYDKKAAVFNGLYIVRSLAVAVRMFADTLADADSQYARHPEDFALYKLADWDEESGDLHPVPSLSTLVIEAEEVVRRSAPPRDARNISELSGELPLLEG